MNLQDLFDDNAGRRFYKPSDEQREKMRVAKLGKSRALHTEETKAKMSEAAKGRTHNAEARAKISAAVKGRKISAETCAKLSEANKKRDYSKPLMTPQGVFPSVALASQAFDVSPQTFYRWMKQQSKQYYFIAKEA